MRQYGSICYHGRPALGEVPRSESSDPPSLAHLASHSSSVTPCGVSGQGGTPVNISAHHGQPRPYVPLRRGHSAEQNLDLTGKSIKAVLRRELPRTPGPVEASRTTEPTSS